MKKSIIIFLSIVLISCKSKTVTEEKVELFLGNIETDTLFFDKYAWPFFVTPEEKLYFIKKSNNLFLGNSLIGNIPIIMGPQSFVISNNYLAFSFIDTTFLNVVAIYCLKNQFLINKTDNSFISDVLYEENCFILYNDNTKRLEVYAVKSNDIVFWFSEYENYPFVGFSKIYTYNALRLKDENGLLKVNVYDKSTFAKENELIIGNPQGRMAIAFMEYFYIAAKGNTIFFVDFQGKDFGKITLPTNNKYQTLLTSNNTVSFYFWDSDINEEYGDFNLIRQKVTIINKKTQN